MFELKKKLILRLPAILLLAGSVLFWSNYERYQPVGPLLLSSPGLADASRVLGDCTETNGIFTLHVPKDGKKARVDFNVSEALDHELVRVRGRIKVDGVIAGKYSWHCARLLLTQYDHHNKWISGEHGLVAERGSKDWAYHEDVFEIIPGARRVLVNIQQAGTAGTAWFDQLEAQAVKLRASFPWWRICFALLWVAAAVLYFPRCRLHRRKLHLLILLNAAVIIVGTLMPSDVIKAGEEIAREQLEQIAKPKPVPEKHKPTEQKAMPAKEIKKLPVPIEPSHMDRVIETVGRIHLMGHYVLFASLCFLVYLSAALERQHPIYFAKVGFDIFLFACITESLQYLTLDRTPGISDMLIDVYGMATALLLFVCALPVVRKFASGK